MCYSGGDDEGLGTLGDDTKFACVKDGEGTHVKAHVIVALSYSIFRVPVHFLVLFDSSICGTSICGTSICGS